MANYAYKELVEKLAAGNMLDSDEEPRDKARHGNTLTWDHDGNIHSIAVERIEDLERRLQEAKWRIADMLQGDDGQAWQEAERFMKGEEGQV